MSAYHQHYADTMQYSQPVKTESGGGSWTGAIALFLIILLIIAAIIYVADRGVPTIADVWTWNIVDGSASAATDTFDATGGQMFNAVSTSAAYNLVLTVPATAKGQMFLVANNRTAVMTVSIGTGTIATIAVKDTAQFVWTSQTTAQIVSKN